MIPDSSKDVQNKLWDLSVFLRHLEHGCDADLIPDAKLFSMKARKSAAGIATKTSSKQNWMNQGTAELAHINAHNKLPAARSSQRQGWFQAGQLLESAVSDTTVNKTSHLAGGDVVFALTSARTGELVGSFGLVMTAWRRVKKSALPVCRPVSKDLCSFVRIALMSPRANQVDGLVTLYADGYSPTQVLDPHRILVNFELPDERYRRPKGSELKIGTGLSAVFSNKEIETLKAQLDSAEVQLVMGAQLKQKRRIKKRLGQFVLKAHKSAAMKKAKQGGKHGAKGPKKTSEKKTAESAKAIPDGMAGDAEQEPPKKHKKLEAEAVSLKLGKALIEDCADNYNRGAKGKELMQQRILLAFSGSY